MPNYYDYPAANTSASIIVPSKSDEMIIVDALQWSYSADPGAAASVLVEDAGEDIFQHWISKSGPGFFNFPNGLRLRRGSELQVTLQTGGVGVTCRLTVQTR